MRGICHEAGLATRYFYENFSDKDQFIGDVFDWAIGRLAATTQAAVSSAPAEEQNRAGIANIVRIIESDPRIGRLMFGAHVANSAVIRKRRDSEAFFAMLSGRHVETLLSRPGSDRIQALPALAIGAGLLTTSWWRRRRRRGEILRALRQPQG